MATLMEFNACLDQLQEAILSCRPRNIHAFAVRYFSDEKASVPEEAHAVHAIPFLMFNSARFKNAACTIFCHHISSGESTKQFLDPQIVCSIISRMDLRGLGLRCKTIDELAQARVMGLKQVTFELFLSSIRFPLSCYQLVVWIHYKIAHMHEDMTTSETTSTISTSTAAGASTSKTDSMLGCLQTVTPRTVDIHKLKQWLQRDSQVVTPTRGQLNKGAKSDRWSSRRSCAYHMHECIRPETSPVGAYGIRTSLSVAGPSPDEVGICGVSFTDTETRQLMRLLGSTADGLLEGAGSNTVTLEDFVDAFMSRYLKQLPQK